LLLLIFNQFVNNVFGSLQVHVGQCYGPLADPLKHALDDPFWEYNLTQWGCDHTDNRPCQFSVSPCPTTRHKHASDSLMNPHMPAWNASSSGAQAAAMLLPHISHFVSERQHIGFRNRSSSLLDLDYLVGVVLDGALELDPGLSNTYFFFSSDNGFHLGEHRMSYGKQHPYETDVSLPFYAAGPGVPVGSTLQHPTTHIDLTATLVELAGAKPTRELEGLSFASLFKPSPPSPQEWRRWQFSEHHCGLVTWRKLRFPLVGDNYTYHMWCGVGTNSSEGTQEVFDHNVDPWELSNIAQDGLAGAKLASELGPLAEFLWTCSGSQCHNPKPQKVQQFQCYTVNSESTLDSNEFDWDP
jgi:arylsulfatase A-like enzyme